MKLNRNTFKANNCGVMSTKLLKGNVSDQNKCETIQLVGV